VPGACFLQELILSLLFTNHVPRSTSNLYTPNDIRGLLNKYITSQQLINPHDQAYINLNEPLITCITAKHPGEAGKKAEKTPGEDESSSPPEFMKREELMRGIVEHMQPWHEVKAEGKDTTTA
jgi:translation initiation factor 2D